jgi:hypothetical protein
MPRTLALPLLLLACTPAGRLPSSQLDTESPPVDSADSGPDTSPPDTDPPGPPPEGEGSEEISAAENELRFTPGASTFTEGVSVALSGFGDLRYTTDGTIPTASNGADYAGSIDISESTVLCARQMPDGETRCRPYLQVTGTAEGFDSNLPLLVLHTQSYRPSDTGAAAVFTSWVLLTPGADGRTPLVGEGDEGGVAGLGARGSSTSSFPKTPFKFELWKDRNGATRKEGLLDMPAEGDWVLYPPYAFDQSMVRNQLMYALARDLGHYAPRTAAVEVFVTDRGGPVNADDYFGLYVLMEEIKIAPERVAIDELESVDIEPPEVTGGYLFKRDRTGSGEGGFDAGGAGGAFYFGTHLVNVDPQEEVIEPEQQVYLRDAINTMGRALAAADGTDATTGSHYTELLDRDAWIDDHILNTYAKNPDAFRLSAYFYKPREGKITAGPLWDFDRALGAPYDGRAEDPTWWDATHLTSDTTDFFDYGWYPGLFKDPDFTDAWYDRWEVLLADVLAPENVSARVEELTAPLEEAALRNNARWPDYGPRGSFSNEVEIHKDWVEARSTWIAACVASRPADPESCRGG